jgi:hypothetical protein
MQRYIQCVITSIFVNCCTLHYKNNTRLVIGRFKGTVKLTIENYKDTHRNKPENYFLGLLDIKGVLLIPCFHPFNNKN